MVCFVITFQGFWSRLFNWFNKRSFSLFNFSSFEFSFCLARFLCACFQLVHKVKSYVLSREFLFWGEVFGLFFFYNVVLLNFDNMSQWSFWWKLFTLSWHLNYNDYLIREGAVEVERKKILQNHLEAVWRLV